MVLFYFSVPELNVEPIATRGADSHSWVPPMLTESTVTEQINTLMS